MALDGTFHIFQSILTVAKSKCAEDSDVCVKWIQKLRKEKRRSEHVCGT